MEPGALRMQDYVADFVLPRALWALVRMNCRLPFLANHRTAKTWEANHATACIHLDLLAGWQNGILPRASYLQDCMSPVATSPRICTRREKANPTGPDQGCRIKMA